MDAKATRRAYLIATMGGMALWIATALAGGRREPWDTGLYWTISYPLALAGATALGYLFPARPWRWALVVICSQMLVMVASGSGLGLLPLGLALLAILCLPAVILAQLAALVRRRTGWSARLGQIIGR